MSGIASSGSTATKTRTILETTTAPQTKRFRGLISFLPLGMSCRGRAEAFARRLQFRLRSLSAQEQQSDDADGPTDAAAEDGSQPSPGARPPLASSKSSDGSTTATNSPALDYIDLIATTTTRHIESQSAATSTSTQVVDTLAAAADQVSLSSSEGTFFDLDGNAGDGESSASVSDIDLPVDGHSARVRSSSESSDRCHADYFDCDDSLMMADEFDRDYRGDADDDDGGRLLLLLNREVAGNSSPLVSARHVATGTGRSAFAAQMEELRRLQSSPVIGGRAPPAFRMADDSGDAVQQQQQQQQQSPGGSFMGSNSTRTRRAAGADESSRTSTTMECSSDSGSESLPASQSTSLSVSSSSSATMTGCDTDTYDSSAAEKLLQQHDTLVELARFASAAHDGDVDGAEATKAEPQPIDDDDNEKPDDDAMLLAVDPLLEAQLEQRDNEEACNADDAAVMLVNESAGAANEAATATAGIDADDRQTSANPVSQSSSCSSVDEPAENGGGGGGASERPQKLRRCSSLKSGKTPPGTPGRKKFVRFADVLGLDLADVKTFLDEVPTVPRCAYDYLSLSTDENYALAAAAATAAQTAAAAATAASANQRSLSPGSFAMDKMLQPMFQQPGGHAQFLERVRELNVCLERAEVVDPICLTISGTVRVRNLDFHKSVHLRYTLDEWVTFADFQATYVEQSCDGFSDQFAFTIFGNSLRVGQRLVMAVRFSCKGEQFWDSNYGANYVFECVPAGPAWMRAPASLQPPQPPVPAATTAAAEAAAATSVDDEADALFY